MTISLLDNQCRKDISEFIKRNQDRIDYNTRIYSILEGDIKTPLEEKLRDDLPAKSFFNAQHRMSPINYFRKVIDKLTTIYQTGVVRTVVDGTDSDDQLLRWYEDILELNPKLNITNEFHNAFEYSLLFITLSDPEPITGNQRPFVRTIPNHEFLVMNRSNVDPTSPDIIIVFMGIKTFPDGTRSPVFFVYTDTEFVIIDGNGDILQDEMVIREQDGTNPFGVTPFAYTNTSQNQAMPLIQTDNLDLALLVPTLLTDLNYASKFQSFSMYVAKDLADGDIDIAPEAILHLKSDPQGEDPDFSVIKATVDYADVLNLSSSQISLWLSSKGIRPGTIGQTDADSFSSGISKLIDESDTFENRKKQIEIFEFFERIMWAKITKVFHPAWSSAGLIENRTQFSSNASIITKFPEPKPMQTRMETIQELIIMVDNDLETRFNAIRALNPDMSDEQIEEKMTEIDAERAFKGLFEGGDDATESDGNTDNAESA